MRRLALTALAPLALAAPAWAQDADPHAGHHGHAAHARAAAPADPHAGHTMPEAPADPHAGHAMPDAPADPHAGHTMPEAPADPHAGHAMPAAPADPHAGHAMPAAPADPHAGHTMPEAPADPHAGHTMPAAPADPHAGHAMPAAPADPHAGHTMPAAPADPHAGHAMPAALADPHAGHAMPSAPPPAPPRDHAAEAFYSAREMAAARDQLRVEHGGMRWSQVVLETAEVRPSSDGDGYAFEGEFSWGGDINRFVVASEGEGLFDERPEQLEVQALWRRAVSPYFNLLAGVRQDFEPRPRRTYAAVEIEGVSPYWVELSAAAFLSDEGKLSARLEASTDLRLTQRLVLQPRAEANLAASDDEEIGVGSGLSDVEVGLRLRYHLTPAIAPYLGVVHERSFGQTADFARAHGDEVGDTRAVIGLTAIF